jgi:hypothetical protein
MEVPIVVAVIGSFSGLIAASALNALQVRKDRYLALMAEKRRVYSDLCSRFSASLFERQIATITEPVEAGSGRFWKAKNVPQLLELEARVNGAIFYADAALESELRSVAMTLHLFIGGGGMVHGISQSSHDRYSQVARLNHDPDSVLQEIFGGSWKKTRTLMRLEIGLHG